MVFYYDTGAILLRKLLCVNCTLQVLNMGANPIRDDGLAHIMQGLYENNTLTEFTAEECGLSDKGTTHGSYLQCLINCKKFSCMSLVNHIVQ